MTNTFLTESHERRWRNQPIVIENRTPAYRTWEEKERVKKETEERLFDIFCKYVAVRA